MNIILARDLRPVPQHIATPGTRPFYLSHSGEVVIQATMWDVNLRDLYDLLRGGRYDQFIRFRILEGAAIYATAGYALDTGDWPTGTNLTLKNRGRVQGKAGDGGDGGDDRAYGSAGPHGKDGEDGGGAINLSYDLTVDNTDGEIFGGGGGGGGGGASSSLDLSDDYTGGGGGGGGAGNLIGYGGDAGAAGEDGIWHTPPEDGEDGTHEAGGTGGAGGGAYVAGAGMWLYAGDGGAGGDPGEAGADGGSTPQRNGGAGGAAGGAIDLNGYSVTWSGGNNSTQVKGSVS